MGPVKWGTRIILRWVPRFKRSDDVLMTVAACHAFAGGQAVLLWVMSLETSGQLP